MAYSEHLWSAGETVTAANMNAATYTNGRYLKGRDGPVAIENGASFAGNVGLSMANTIMELGATDSANTPGIDFHSSGTNHDYDARILASGGDATVGNGALALTAAGGVTINGMRPLRVSIAGTYHMEGGVATLADGYPRWSDSGVLVNFSPGFSAVPKIMFWTCNATGAPTSGVGTYDPNAAANSLGNNSVKFIIENVHPRTDTVYWLAWGPD